LQPYVNEYVEFWLSRELQAIFQFFVEHCRIVAVLYIVTTSAAVD